MKKIVASQLALMVLLFVAIPAQAEAPKPVLVVSLAGYDELTADINFIGQLAGQPNAAGMLEGTIQMMTQGQGLKGLDKSKPWGMVVSSTEGGFKPMIFLPVSDVKQLATALQGVAGPASEEDGALKFTAPDGEDLFVREKSGWAYVTRAIDDPLPDDPVKLLEGLNTQYDIAARAYLQNVPQEVKESGLTQLKYLMQLGAAQRAAGQDEAMVEMQRLNVEQQMKSMERVLNEADQLTFGWLIDNKAKNTHVDLSLTAVPGSELAEQLKQLDDTHTDYAGFLLPQAAVTWNNSTRSSPEQIDSAVQMLQQFRQQAEESIDKDDSLRSEEARAQVKDVLQKLFEVAEQTVKAGKMDLGLAVMLESGKFQLAAGGFVADGPKVDEALNSLIQLADEGKLKEVAKIERDFDTYEGMKFHHASVKIDDNDARKVLGDRLELYFGVGPQSAFVAVGEGSYDLLKSTIAKSKAEANKAVLPMQMTIALAPIFEFIAGLEGADPRITALAKELAKSRGKDRVLITVKPIPGGAQYRFEVEEGILQAVGEMAKQRAPGNVPAIGGANRQGAGRAF